MTGQPLQVFGNERTAVIEGLPSLEGSVTFFQTESAGPATANLEDMQQDRASDLSSDADDAADMDHSDLPAPVPVKQSAGQTHSLCCSLCICSVASHAGIVLAASSRQSNHRSYLSYF